MDLKLRFSSLLVGEIKDAFCSEDTWYGIFHQAADASPDSTLQRLREYIAFSEEWHTRLKAEQPHTAEEWDAFRDVYESPLWHTVADDGTINPICGPVFVAGEITWRAAE